MAHIMALRQAESDRSLYGQHANGLAEGYPSQYRQSHQRFGGEYRHPFAASHHEMTDQPPYLPQQVPQQQVRNVGPYDPAPPRRVLQSFF
jgi:hypothetical protein